MGKPSKHKGVKSRLAVIRERHAAAIEKTEANPWSYREVVRGWTMLLDGYAETTVARKLGRSRKAVNTLFMYKLTSKEYAPKYPTPKHAKGALAREHKVWNQFELWVLRTMCNNRWTPEEAAGRLARSTSAVLTKWEQLQADNRPSFGL